MVTTLIITITACLLPITSFCAAGTDTALTQLEYIETIHVTGRLATTENDASRSVTVISSDDIQSLPVNGLADILTYAAGVDIRQRGTSNVQADIAIRGGSIEQTRILLNGTPMNDSQTGHHNLDLALSINDIERIEVLKGHGAGSRGPGGYQGSVNIITRQPLETGASITGQFGSHHSTSGVLSLDLVTENHNLSLSANRSISRGYRDNTEHAMNGVFLATESRFSEGCLSLTAGAGEKKFGAYMFYSDAYPDQWEATKNIWATVSYETETETPLASTPLTLTPSLTWRRHDDEFILDRYRPQWYRNLHETNQFQGNLTAHTAWKALSMAVGLEWQHDDLDSSNLGCRHRWQSGGFVDTRIAINPAITVNTAISAYQLSDHQWQWSPSFDIGIELNDQSHWFAAAGRSYRLPTFTELYYVSPANVGNPELDPESTLSIESGVRWRFPGFRCEMAGFYRRGSDQIDWVRQSSEDPWKVQNISRITMTGAECRLWLVPDQFVSWIPIERIQLDYTWLNSDYSVTDIDSKYIASHLEHQLVFLASHQIWANLSCHWTVRFEDRINSENLILGDLRLVWQHNQFKVWCDINNITDRDWDSVTGVPMSGRVISSGINITI